MAKQATVSNGSASFTPAENVCIALQKKKEFEMQNCPVA